MNYIVKVNGRAYEVEVERKSPGVPQVPAPVQPQVTPQAAAPPPAAVASDTEITSPLPGSVFNILVNPGDAVSEGQTLIVIEAMKMENEVVAPRSGTVKQVLASKGSLVEAGDVLIVIS
ncbi:MAG: biotin/lipoyl-binding protein [Defluviitaleaceae bacterium]|nr:biotin/lipoyl-binding protein [Defluviitaleaceae bacterium]